MIGALATRVTKYTWQIREVFGLDTLIDNYKETRAIFFYSWDLNYMLDVLDMMLNAKKEYPKK